MKLIPSCDINKPWNIWIQIDFKTIKYILMSTILNYKRQKWFRYGLSLMKRCATLRRHCCCSTPQWWPTQTKYGSFLRPVFIETLYFYICVCLESERSKNRSDDSRWVLCLERALAFHRIRRDCLVHTPAVCVCAEPVLNCHLVD